MVAFLNHLAVDRGLAMLGRNHIFLDVHRIFRSVQCIGALVFHIAFCKAQQATPIFVE